MPKKGRKPGEFKKQQEEHQARQRLYDALRLMRDQGCAQARFKGRDFILWAPGSLVDPGTRVLAKVGSRFRNCILLRDGALMDAEDIIPANRKHILAILEPV